MYLMMHNQVIMSFYLLDKIKNTEEAFSRIATTLKIILRSQPDQISHFV